MYILYYIWIFPYNLLFDVHVVLQMHGMLAGSLVWCIQGQVLAHWVTVCRWYDGWPQPSHPILSYPFQIAGLSILQHGVLRSVLDEQSCIVLQVFVHLYNMNSKHWFVLYLICSLCFAQCCISRCLHFCSASNEALLCRQHTVTGNQPFQTLSNHHATVLRFAYSLSYLCTGGPCPNNLQDTFPNSISLKCSERFN